MFFFLLKNDLLSIKNVCTAKFIWPGKTSYAWNKAGCEVKTKFLSLAVDTFLKSFH